MSVQALSTQRVPSPQSSARSLRDAQRSTLDRAGAVRRPQIWANRSEFSDIRYRATLPRWSTLDVTVALVDPHDAVHTAVQMWCREADPPIGFAGGFATPDAYLERYRGAIVPDVVVLALGPDCPPDYDRLTRVTSDGHRVIVYSHLSTTETVLRCLELGAVTYLVKSEGRRHLIEAIRAASTDDPYIGPRMAEALAQETRSGRPNPPPREKDVRLEWLKTESKDLVARGLSIAPTTSFTHLQRIRAKYAAVGMACAVAG